MKQLTGLCAEGSGTFLRRPSLLRSAPEPARPLWQKSRTYWSQPYR